MRAAWSTTHGPRRRRRCPEAGGIEILAIVDGVLVVPMPQPSRCPDAQSAQWQEQPGMLPHRRPASAASYSKLKMPLAQGFSCIKLRCNTRVLIAMAAKHGTQSRYTQGCRCVGCVEAHKLYQRDYRRQRKASGAVTPRASVIVESAQVQKRPGLGRRR